MSARFFNATTDEIAMAAHVRALAQELRAVKLQDDRKTWEREAGKPHNPALEEKWREDNPLMQFVPMAYEELSEIAMSLRGYRPKGEPQ